MSIVFRFLFVLLFGLLLIGCRKSYDKEGLNYVNGEVHDLESKNMIPGATVYLAADNSSQIGEEIIAYTTTDQNGRFEIIYNGNQYWNIIVTASGYRKGRLYSYDKMHKSTGFYIVDLYPEGILKLNIKGSTSGTSIGVTDHYNASHVYYCIGDSLDLKLYFPVTGNQDAYVNYDNNQDEIYCPRDDTVSHTIVLQK